jgi:fermentation-respiration switch protein FrsA (DUF1100 family)
MLTVLVIAGFLALLLLWAGQRRMIYFPDQNVPSPESVGLAGVEQITFRTDDGVDLRGWWVAAAAPNGTSIIVFNGNVGNRAYRAALAAPLARRGYSVLLFDYRGYGGNSGSPTEEGLAQDARAALRFVKTRTGVDPNRIVHFGESLGAAVAIRLATEQQPAALILRSPFTSLAAVGQHHYPYLPVRWLLRDQFPSKDRIRDVKSPVLVIMGTRDGIVPAEQSRELFEAANQPKRLEVIPGADHNDYELLAGERMLAGILEFLRQRSAFAK